MRPLGAREAPSCVVDVVVAASIRAIRADRTRLKVLSSLDISPSKSLRYFVSRAWLKISGCLTATIPSSRILSPTWSIHLPISVIRNGLGESAESSR